MRDVRLEKPLTWIRHLDEGTEKISLESAPPVVVRTVPMAGGAGVDPALTEIRVTYSNRCKTAVGPGASGTRKIIPRPSASRAICRMAAPVCFRELEA